MTFDSSSPRHPSRPVDSFDQTEPFSPTPEPAGVPFGHPDAAPAMPPGPDPSPPRLGATFTPVGPVAPIAPQKRRTSTSTLVNALLGLAVVVAVGGVAFAAGRVTAPAPTTGTRTGNGGFTNGFGPNPSGAPGRGGFAFGGNGGGLSIQGTVTAVATDSITIQLASGQTITIPTDAQTAYRTASEATAADVTDGSKVVVQLAPGRFGGGGNGGDNGNGNGGNGPAASGAPNGGGRGLGGPATSVTVIPAGS